MDDFFFLKDNKPVTNDFVPHITLILFLFCSVHTNLAFEKCS